MVNKKAIIITVLSAALLYGGYAGCKRIKEYRAEQKQAVVSIESRINEVDSSIKRVVSETKRMLESNPEFVDSIVKREVSNNTEYVLSLIPDKARAEYVSKNYRILSEEAKKEIAREYISKQFEEKKEGFKDFVRSVDEKTKSTWEWMKNRGSQPKTTVEAENKVKEKVIEYFFEDGKPVNASTNYSLIKKYVLDKAQTNSVYGQNNPTNSAEVKNGNRN